MLKKQGTSFQFCLGFEESRMVAQSSTVAMLLGSPMSQKLKEKDTGDFKSTRDKVTEYTRQITFVLFNLAKISWGRYYNLHCIDEEKESQKS